MAIELRRRDQPSWKTTSIFKSIAAEQWRGGMPFEGFRRRRCRVGVRRPRNPCPFDGGCGYEKGGGRPTRKFMTLPGPATANPAPMTQAAARRQHCEGRQRHLDSERIPRMLLGRMLARLLAQLAESRRSTTDVGQSVAVHGLRPPLSSKKRARTTGLSAGWSRAESARSKASY